jgi:hypothetical protein
MLHRPESWRAGTVHWIITSVVASIGRPADFAGQLHDRHNFPETVALEPR